MDSKEKADLVEDVLDYVIKKVGHYLDSSPMKITTKQLCKYLETIKYQELKACDPTSYFSRYDRGLSYLKPGQAPKEKWAEDQLNEFLNG